MLRFNFPIVIIDEDFRSENTSGLGIRALAAAIEKEGFEVLGATGYGDLSQFAQQQSRASAFILSIDDEEFTPGPELDPAVVSLRKFIQEIRFKNAEIPIYLYGETRTSQHLPNDVLRELHGFIHMFEDTPEFVARARGLGLLVIPYTVNTKTELAPLLAAGVDGVFTDDPMMLRRTLSRGEPSEDGRGPLAMGIDQGSGGTRAVLIDSSGAIVASHATRVSSRVGKDGAIVQDADRGTRSGDRSEDAEGLVALRTLVERDGHDREDRWRQQRRAGALQDARRNL